RREPRLPVRRYPPPLAVVSPDSCLGLKRRTIPDRADSRPNVLRLVSRVDQRLPLVPFHFFGSDAEELAVSTIHKSVFALRIRHPDHRRATVCHAAESLLALP